MLRASHHSTVYLMRTYLKQNAVIPRTLLQDTPFFLRMTPALHSSPSTPLGCSPWHRTPPYTPPPAAPGHRIYMATKRKRSKPRGLPYTYVLSIAVQRSVLFCPLFWSARDAPQSRGRGRSRSTGLIARRRTMPHNREGCGWPCCRHPEKPSYPAGLLPLLSNS